ncbi:MAG: DUF6338 family protein [Armatimonadota bacterium]
MPTLTVEGLQLFLFFVVPGFVTLTVYDVLRPREPRDFSKAVIELICYSMLNLAVASPLLLISLRPGFASPGNPYYLALNFAVAFAIPALLAYSAFRLRMSRLAAKWLGRPLRPIWDEFFHERESCFILFHLKDGRKVAGFYGRGSVATRHPLRPEIYVSQVWRVDQETGRILGPVAGSIGMMVREADCELIEFFRAEEA